MKVIIKFTELNDKLMPVTVRTWEINWSDRGAKKDFTERANAHLASRPGNSVTTINHEPLALLKKLPKQSEK